MSFTRSHAIFVALPSQSGRQDRKCHRGKEASYFGGFVAADYAARKNKAKALAASVKYRSRLFHLPFITLRENAEYENLWFIILA